MEQVNQQLSDQSSSPNNKTPFKGINQLGISGIIIGIIALLLLGSTLYLFGIYSNQGKTSTSKDRCVLMECEFGCINGQCLSKPTATSDTIANWKTYHKDELLIEFKYPSNWFDRGKYKSEYYSEYYISNENVDYDNLSKNGLLISISKQTEDFGLAITSYKTAKEYFDAYSKKDNVIATSIDNNPAIREVRREKRINKYNQYDSNELYIIKYTILHNNSIYGVVLDGPDNQSVKNNEQLFSHILSTFIFLDQSRMESMTVNLCDLNDDDKCDTTDQTLFKQILGKKRGDLEYNLFADADADGIVTITDEQILFPTAQSAIKPYTQTINSDGISPQEAALNQPLHPVKVKAQIIGSVVRVSWSGSGAGIIENEISRKNINSDKWQKIGSVKSVNDNIADYEFMDNDVTSGNSYIYGVNVVGFYNNKSQVTESNPVSIP